MLNVVNIVQFDHSYITNVCTIFDAQNLGTFKSVQLQHQTTNKEEL